MNSTYKRQVQLLLTVLPEVAKEKCFALHGGTAINLFVREMPRLSVDIDLTYVPIQDRESSIAKIHSALGRIKERLERKFQNLTVQDRRAAGKLLISEQGLIIKIEVNLVNRGVLGELVEMSLCTKTRTDFDVFCEMQVIPIGQLYGGKICAALDRQHPRDLFDVKYLLRREGLSEEIKTGFLLALVSCNQPIRELIKPNLLDQRLALENHFAGMSEEEFTYEEFEDTRLRLLDTIYKSLDQQDIEFILGIKGLEPTWKYYDFERFPSVNWKLRNLERLRTENPENYRAQYEALEKTLSEIKKK